MERHTDRQGSSRGRQPPRLAARGNYNNCKCLIYRSIWFRKKKFFIYTVHAILTYISAGNILQIVGEIMKVIIGASVKNVELDSVSEAVVEEVVGVVVFVVEGEKQLVLFEVW